MSAERVVIEADNLSSDKGVNYRKLRDLFKAGRWREADTETKEVVKKYLEVSQKEKKFGNIM
jgi:hypothetical protein